MLSTYGMGPDSDPFDVRKANSSIDERGEDSEVVARTLYRDDSSVLLTLRDGSEAGDGE